MGRYKKVDGETTCFVWDKQMQEWTAIFTERELRSFVRRIKQRCHKKAKCVKNIRIRLWKNSSKNLAMKKRGEVNDNI